MITSEEALLILDKMCDYEHVRGRFSSEYFGIWFEGNLPNAELINR